MKAHKATLKTLKRALVAPTVSAPERESACDFPALFQDVTPLKPERRVFFAPPKPSPHPRRQTRLTESDAMRHASGWFEAAESRPAFLRSGMQTATLKRLRSGHWPVCAELDLHGLTRYEALDQLAAFLQWARARGNTVRVIHGKGIGSSGEAVLKQLTRSWLTHHPEVLAFCETSGGGALLVLLRRMTNV